LRLISATTRKMLSARLPANSIARWSIRSQPVPSSRFRSTDATSIAPM
jgi:hypothetical protein